MSYVCSTCDYASATKLGKCPNCGDFGSFIVHPEGSSKGKKKTQGQILQTKGEDEDQAFNKSYLLKHPELDRIYPGGLRSSGVYLIAGEPGIGKSTVVLQIIQSLIAEYEQIKISYFTGEESVQQVTARIKRILGGIPPQIHVYYTISMDDCIATANSVGSDVMIIDSIQMISSSASDSMAGTPAQIKTATELLAYNCKSYNRIALLVGHVTKGGEIAGPKYLEHIVDVVSYLEGDRYGNYRFLRNKKNRYGSADEVAVFEMTQGGLISVRNLNQAHLGLIQTGQEGTVMSVGLDSSRPVVIGGGMSLHQNKNELP